MLDFSNFLDLPLIWGFLIATAIFLYVVLDGFDLGIGILFPFAPSNKCRNKMMNSIAPFWDGNETWLVLGGGGLFAAFPLAYAIIMPAVYLPIIFMLIGLILRGVAFEFRFKASEEKQKIWDYVFHFGSLLATFMQGMVLGGVLNGIETEGRSFSGGPLSWLTSFSVMTGFALVFGYALLGGTWLIMRTNNETQIWAKSASRYSLFFVSLSMCFVSISMPFMNEGVRKFWFTTPNIYYLSFIPFVTLLLFINLWSSLNKQSEYKPFICTMGIFLMSFLGLALSLYPYIIPYKITIWQAAAAPESLSLMLIGASVMLPTILCYTAYCYYIFWGKASDEKIY